MATSVDVFLLWREQKSFQTGMQPVRIGIPNVKLAALDEPHMVGRNRRRCKT
jgi:hypothetical protein